MRQPADIVPVTTFRILHLYLKGIASDIPLTDIYRGIVPFVLLQVLVTVLCIVFPGLCL